MSFSQFTNLDFNTLRAQIKDYLRSNSNFSDFDFEGANFSVLIDTLAYNSTLLLTIQIWLSMNLSLIVQLYVRMLYH